MSESNSTKTKRSMNILLPQSLVTVLDQRAIEEGHQSRASIIRRACAEYLRRSTPAETGSTIPQDVVA